MTVSQIERMGASELAEWRMFYESEPWGPRRDNIHAGIIASTIANIYRKKNSKPMTFEDFLLVDPEEHRKKQTRKFLGWMSAVAKKANHD